MKAEDMELYHRHLHDERWPMIRVTTGKGLEISDNGFIVLPRAIKILQQDDDRYALRFLCEDFSTLDEIAPDTLNYIFVTEPEQHYICDRAIKSWTTKLLEGGYLILHSRFKGEFKFKIYQKTDGALKAWLYPKRPAKSVGVIRYGAFGDMMMASSVLKGLKDKGYHVTLYCSPPGSDVMTHDPNIDEIVLQDKDQVRNHELSLYWNFLKTRHDKFINLCESVEKNWLVKRGDSRFEWPIEVREKYLNVNYLEFQHDLAGVKHNPQVKFYPTPEELKWAKEERSKMGKKVILWSLAGSSLHKAMPWLDEFVARVMTFLPDVHVVLVGGPETFQLQAGWQEEPRVHLTVGEWSIRQSLTFAQTQADLVIGPETGVLNAVSCDPVPKIIFLSHSTVINLTRDWTNTKALFTPLWKLKCGGCCLHRLHENQDGWENMERDPVTGAAHCQAEIDREKLWKVAIYALETGQV